MGRETARGWNQGQFTRRYTSYERDANQSDEAMMRRYNRWHLRFDQPDPYDGSYKLTDPQSLNRYTYVQNDPVNFSDPTGLQRSDVCGAQYSFADCGGSAGFWGGNFGPDVAEYNRDFAGLPPHIASALANHHDRLQNTLDALDAQRALEAGDWDLLTTILSANSTLELVASDSASALMGVHIYNPFSPQRGPVRPPPRRGGGGGNGGRAPTRRFPGLKDHTRRHQIGGRTLTYEQYLQSAVRHTQRYHARYLVRYHVNGHNFTRLNYVSRPGPDTFLFTSTSPNGRLLFTHMEVNGQYLRNQGIHVISHPPNMQGPPTIP